jgi:hypothetical protein
MIALRIKEPDQVVGARKRRTIERQQNIALMQARAIR